MDEKRSKPDKQGKEATESAQNDPDFLSFQRLFRVFGQDHRHPFEDLEKSIAYLEAFHNYLRKEAETGSVNGIVPRSVQVETTDSENPQIFYDYAKAKATFYIPSVPNESKADEMNRKVLALAHVWPALHASAQRIAYETIQMMAPSAREKFLEKYHHTSKGAEDGKSDTGG